MKSELDHLNKALWQASQILPGYLAPQTSQKYLLTMFFYKALSDALETPTQAKLHDLQFVLPEGSEFAAQLQNAQTPGLDQRLDQALLAIEIANPQQFSGLFQASRFASHQLGDVLGRNQLTRQLMQRFAQADLQLSMQGFVRPDTLAEAFGYGIRQYAAHGKLAASDYPTPPALANLLVYLLAPQAGEQIYDPCCGSGGLLLACTNYLGLHQPQHSASLYGEELEADLLNLARMRLHLQNWPQHHLYAGDSIHQPYFVQQNRLQQFDAVLCVPPQRLTFCANSGQDDKYARFAHAKVEMARPASAFVQHVLASLRPDGGRAAIVLPYVTLFRQGEERKLRRHLLESKVLEAVICLPKWLFPGAGRPNALLLLRRNASDPRISFIDASHCPRDQGELLAARLEHACRSRSEIPGFARSLHSATLATHDYHLNVKRYLA